jgi:hypothetical protein
LNGPANQIGDLSVADLDDPQNSISAENRIAAEAASPVF